MSDDFLWEDMLINYRIEAIEELLNQDCVLTRYDPLNPHKAPIIDFFQNMNCSTKEECRRLPDDLWHKSGLLSPTEIPLLKEIKTHIDVAKAFTFFQTYCH